MHISVRKKSLVVCLAIGSLFSGVISLGDWLRQPSPTRLSYAQFVQENPHKGWYQIDDGSMDLAGGTVASTEEHDAYRVPLRGPGDTVGSPVHVFVYVTDNSLVRQIDAYNLAHNRQTTGWAQINQSRLGPPPANTLVPTVISGTIMTPGAENGDNAQQQQAPANAGDTITIAKDVHPSILLALCLIITGIALSVFSLSLFGVHIDLGALKDRR